MNKNYIIGSALILGGGLYYAYTKGLFDKFIKPKETPKEESQAELDRIATEQAAAAAAATAVVKTTNEVRQASTITNTNSYAGKVSYIQQKLGIAVDGNPGFSANSQTNKNYAAVYGLDKGIISTTNIDYYKSKVEKNLTLAAQKAAAAAAAKKAASVVNVANDAKRFLELVNRGKYKATLKNDVKANAFVFDNFKEVFVDVNQPATFPKGMSFGKGDFGRIPRGGYVLKKGANNKYFALNPADFLVTL